MAPQLPAVNTVPPSGCAPPPATTFDRANNSLQTDVGTDDVACPLTLAALESYEWWYSADNIDSTVSDQGEYQNHQANAAHGWYLIVNNISWCGAFQPNIGGCGWPQSGQQPIIVTRPLAVHGARGQVLAHEFGHAVGIGHETTGLLSQTHERVKSSVQCNSGFRRMFSTSCPASGSNSGLTAPAICSQASAFRSETPVTEFAASEEHLDTDEVERHALKDYSAVSIRELAEGFFLDRVPFEAEDYYGAADSDELISLLQGKTLAEPYMNANAVVLIGLIGTGTDKEVDAILGYASEPNANNDAAYMALGYLVQRQKSSAALSSLLKARTSGKAEVVQAALLGLTVSGHPSALTALREHANANSDKRRAKFMQSLIDDNQVVASRGLRGYYEREVAPTAADPESPVAGFDPNGP